MIRGILACDDDWGIGKDGGLPWPHNPADLAWFKENTINSTVVMGRNTWNSLPFKPLPKRHNIVVSNTMTHYGVEVVRPDIYRSRLNVLSKQGDVWIIGGAHLIETSLDIMDEIWLSHIEGTYDCDVFLPHTLIELTYTLFSSRREGDVWINKWRKV